MNIQITLLTVFVCVFLPKSYDGRLTYNYFDEMAQSYCASRSLGYVFSLRRNCAGRANTCEEICAGAKTELLASINYQRKRVKCFDAYHISKYHSKLRDNPSSWQPDAEKVNLKTYGYGNGGCTWKANHCGPNYCCCKAY
ncbi:uncharacterized protein LOC134697340 [Mytilus trossulus]|uniref:uncharacterized protein LOC134697340 n=1 Tax=Mytilus trossulus TaxID=6551 RepID=UPI00300685E2